MLIVPLEVAGLNQPQFPDSEFDNYARLSGFSYERVFITREDALRLESERGLAINPVGTDLDHATNYIYVRVLNPKTNNWSGHIDALPTQDGLIDQLHARDGKLYEVDGIFPEQLRSLADKRVAVIGNGTVGSSVIAQLAKTGVGNFDIIDADKIDLHNTARVPFWTTKDAGRYKVDVARQYILESNPFANVNATIGFLNSDNIDSIITPDTDVVVMAVDSLQAMLETMKRCKGLGISLVLATDLDEKGVLDIARFDNDPNLPIFWGRVTEEDINRLDQGTLIAKIVKPQRASGRILKVFTSREAGDPFPQTATAAAASGAAATKAIISILLGLGIKDISSVDFAQINSPERLEADKRLKSNIMLKMVGGMISKKFAQIAQNMAVLATELQHYRIW